MRSEPAARDALRREQAILGMVQHPAIPQLLAVGEDAQGPYVVQTAHAGVPLRRLVEGWLERRGRVPPEMVLALAEVGFATLAAVHGVADAQGPLGLVHGDLGPDHLIVAPAAKGRRGTIGLVDFGQSRARDLPGRLQDRGTMPYVAPEVLRAESPVDQAADVFALAATIAFAALGGDPCRAPTSSGRLVEGAERGVDLAALDALSGLGGLSTVLRRALAFDRAERLTSAAEVVVRLRAIASDPAGDGP